MDADLVRALKALADPSRLRLLGRLAAGPATRDALASLLPGGRRALDRQLAILEAAGLVTGAPASAGPVRLAVDRLAELGRALDAVDAAAVTRASPDDPELAGLSVDDARVVRGYLVDGRLVALPSTDARRLPVLRWLRDRVFVEDRGYPEREVNAAIALVHPDVASLRRYLVDARLVSREGGIYRRVDPVP